MGFKEKMVCIQYEQTQFVTIIEKIIKALLCHKVLGKKTCLWGFKYNQSNESKIPSLH